MILLKLGIFNVVTGIESDKQQNKNMSTKSKIGMIGLGTMGRNLSLHIADEGFELYGYDPDVNQRNRMLQEAGQRPCFVTETSAELIQKLGHPCTIIMLVPAGRITDLVINELTPNLSPGDILVDGGNAHFTDTERRYQQLQQAGIHFVGMGVSGGETGARNGPSLMPGGSKESYSILEEMLNAIAAKTPDGSSCVDYMGNTSAGHYVKMVHNGIEYALMQLISEVYGVLKNAGFSNRELSGVFDAWNQTELESFLVEITSRIFLQKDDLSGHDLIDVILDCAAQKGTGLWTSQSGLELQVPVPTIDIAVSMRYLSTLKKDRVRLAALYDHQNETKTGDRKQLAETCRQALYFGFVIAYLQGTELLQKASLQYNYEMSVHRVLKVWRAGCIIRSALIGDFLKTWDEKSGKIDILGSPAFISLLQQRRAELVKFLNIAMEAQLAVPAMGSALHYFDARVSASLPANLIQAQRDFFGAHTYERNDREGIFHTIWYKNN
jgi:6-phosphogluconate dehydrogenase